MKCMHQNKHDALTEGPQHIIISIAKYRGLWLSTYDELDHIMFYRVHLA